MSWLPKRRLNAECEVNSLDDLETAVAELSAIETRAKTIESTLAEQIEHNKNEAAKLRVLKVGRSDVSFADRQQSLMNAVRSFCDANRGELLSGKAKSIELAHGKISWKKSRQSVAFVDGLSEADVLERFEARGYQKVLQAALDAISWFGAKLGLFLRVKCSLDKTGILRAHEAGELSEKQLTEAGLEISGGDDQLSISLNEYRA